MSDTKINMDDEREKIRQDIENDFLNCIAEFQIVKFLKNKILESDFQDIEDLFQTLNYDGIKRKQFDSLCKSMGQICEYVFKFLIKIKHTEIYKNHTFDDFSRTQALYNIGSLKKLVQLRYITEDDLNDITSRFSSQNKDKLHNFTYLSMIVEKLMPQTYKNMRRYFELSYCGKLAYIDYCEHKSNSNSYMEYYEALEDILFPNPDRMDQEKKEQFIKEMRNVQTKVGDAFNRLRYFSNNVEVKRYDQKFIRLW